MTLAYSTLRLSDLPRRRLTQLENKARRLGMTVEGYVKRLIEDDLALDRKASKTFLNELAAPFRKALEGVGNNEIDRIVTTARLRNIGRSSRRKR